MEIFPVLNVGVCQQLTQMMERENPYVHIYKQVREAPPEQNISLKLKATSDLNLRRYNKPTAADVAVLMVDSEETTNRREVILRKRDGFLQVISEINPHYDPLQYPLLFPRGETGWHPELLQRLANKRITQKQWIAYYLQIREANREKNPIHLAGKLFQQFIVDQYAKIEQNRLNFFRSNQQKIRAELYQGIQDAMAAGNGRIGRRIVLPSSFTGGPRAMVQLYQDAMAVVRSFGKPDLFITVTCNPVWPEIVRELLPDQKAQDRPDVVVRVFNEKLKQIMKDITKKEIFGKVKAHIHVIEFQKRGLPHAHILIILDNDSKPREPEEYDLIVTAELPDPETQPLLYETVTKNMIHGPCGALNRESPCMKTDGNCGVCSKNYPKEFTAATAHNNDSFPIYRRRDNGRTCIKKVRGRDVTVDNRWVVPYNPYLLQKYNCHINVEICSSISSVKYLYKYVYKGHDRAAVALGEDNEINEISNYIDARYVSSCEAAWRIFEFDLHGQSHSVNRLPVHLEDQQTVTFRDDANMDEVLESRAFTKLTQFFHTCLLDPFARNLTYLEFPHHYVWKEKEWCRRKRKVKLITRMYTVSPGESERFHLRLLLHSVKGPTSFNDLRTFNGFMYDTFKKTAAARGLIDNDTEFDNCLAEATVFALPGQMRQLFGTILVQCNPVHVRQLWDAHFNALSEDFHNETPDRREALAANALREYLLQCGKEYSVYPGLPEIQEHLLQEHEDTRGSLIDEELGFDEATVAADAEKVDQLNHEQRTVYDRVYDAVMNGAPRKNFFVDGPGGAGKTFLYSALIGKLRQENKIVLVVASSGIAAYLLQGGRTAHSRFKIPLDLTSESTCNISLQSELCQLIRQAALIIWDEAPMMHRYAFEALDKTLRDLLGLDQLFGGIPTLLGGDFCQILPVILRGTKTQIVGSCLKKSYIWRDLTVFKLQVNQRVDPNELNFASYLLRIGEGRERTNEDGLIRIPDCMLTAENTIESLVDEVFPDLGNNLNNTDYLVQRSILTPKNVDVDMLNLKISEKIEGEAVVYTSADSIDDDDNAHLFPTEFLNSLTPNGLPAHKLTLKVGMPIVLLRNLNSTIGLCNGTRCVIRALQPHVIDAEIAIGRHKGARVFIPRITLSPSQTNLPFTLKRKQFPIRLSFAMTINKAQGQTLEKVGLYLPSNVFTHGQLYVAFSRAKRQSDIKILNLSNQDSRLTKNVVYKEVF